ncbi:alkaline phosphatase PhoX [Gemmatimonas phototrophica]|uniref:alkaline phosphatase PhoX n=1 Tax=Gemmatimonas phototrophica TaxID=1379270 RepID=UPI00047E77A1|nr:alkaline phosphatase PhoX [Gemmatimonas phototrophica]
MRTVRFSSALLAAASCALLAACGDDSSSTEAPVIAPVALKNQSVTPALLKSLVSGVEIYSLVSSDDQLTGSPSFRFGGSADGAGFIRNVDGTFTMLTNHEDNFAVSRIRFDKDLKPISGDYVVNSTAGRYRLCSASLATVEEHGFSAFLTAGESGEESQILAVDPTGPANTPRYLTGMGRWSAENAVPLSKAAFPNRTVVVIGDDDSGTEGGQVAMYLSNTVGDLDNGNLYVLARTDNNIRERDMVVGQTYQVQFRQVENQKSLSGRQIQQASVTLNAIRFARVEDLDYRKGSAANNREIYFVATGQNNTGVNADYSRSKYGRAYRLRLDANNPLVGTLEVIADGDDKSPTNAARIFQNLDNVYVGTNFAYFQEDDNGYGDETHDAYIYQYNIATRELKPVLEMDHRRTEADAALYNAVGARPAGKAGWEFGAMLDVSTELGQNNTFVIALQPHSWRADKYRGIDGGTLRPNENQASMMVIVKGLPR